MKKLRWILPILLVLITLYFTGPVPSEISLNTILPELKGDPPAFENQLRERESKEPFLKPENEGRIIWADTNTKSKTKYSVVYLHGFSAGPMEGNPVHFDFAKKYGCNLYIPRLYKHGLNEKEPLKDLSAEQLLNSAKEAVAMGKLLGDKVILMSTSTGGTLSLYLASGNPDIHSLILYSPNIELFDPRSFILLQPWGLQLARLVNGGPNYSFSGPEGVEKYWTTSYRIEALISLKQLLRETMKAEVFNKVQQPVFVGYYPDDYVVSVSHIKTMYQQLGTTENYKKIVSFPEAGNHAIASELWSKDVIGVENETYKFAEDVLNLNPIIK